MPAGNYLSRYRFGRMYEERWLPRPGIRIRCFHDGKAVCLKLDIFSYIGFLIIDVFPLLFEKKSSSLFPRI